MKCPHCNCEHIAEASSNEGDSTLYVVKRRKPVYKPSFSFSADVPATYDVKGFEALNWTVLY